MHSAGVTVFGSYSSGSFSEAIVEGYFPFRVQNHLSGAIITRSLNSDFLSESIRLEVGDESFEVSYGRSDIFAFTPDEFYLELLRRVKHAIRYRDYIMPEDHIQLGEN